MRFCKVITIIVLVMGGIDSPAEESLDAHNAEGVVRVMTFNILRDQWAKKGFATWNERGPGVVQVVHKNRPDIIGLQEETADQIAYLTRELSGYQYVKPHHKNGGGLMIRIAVWDVVDSGKIPIPEGRQASWVLVKSKEKGQRWIFYNAHFMHGKAANDAADRMEAAKRIAKHMKENAPRGVPVVMTGDFNALSVHPPMQYLGGEAGSPVKLINTFNVIHGVEDLRGTYHGETKKHNGGRIDHILVDEHVIVHDVEIIHFDEFENFSPSDHYPVQVTLSVSPPDSVQEDSNNLESAEER